MLVVKMGGTEDYGVADSALNWLVILGHLQQPPSP